MKKKINDGLDYIETLSKEELNKFIDEVCENLEPDFSGIKKVKTTTYMRYTIILAGCDDQTEFEMDLSPDEFQLLKRVSDISHEISKSSCMPRLNIKENKK